MKDKTIETFNLTKIYKLKKRHESITAIDNVNLEVYNGEILGLLGPNGAGKTTFLKILCTLLTPTSGTATIYSYDIIKEQKKVKKFISLMLGIGMIYYRVTGWDNLEFFSKIYGVKNYKNKIIQLVKEFELYDWLNEYVENYSLGMRMKLAIIRTLLIDRPIVFLDEPTYSLDPKATKEMLQTISSLRNKNKTIILTTHRMHVASSLCDRIVLIKNGKIFKVDTTKNLKKLITDHLTIEIEIKENKNHLLKDLNSNNFIKKIINKEDGFIIYIKDNSYYQELFEIVKNYKILKFNEREVSLNDVFTTLL